MGDRLGGEVDSISRIIRDPLHRAVADADPLRGGRWFIALEFDAEGW